MAAEVVRKLSDTDDTEEHYGRKALMGGGIGAGLGALLPILVGLAKSKGRVTGQDVKNILPFVVGGSGLGGSFGAGTGLAAEATRLQAARGESAPSTTGASIGAAAGTLGPLAALMHPQMRQNVLLRGAVPIGMAAGGGLGAGAGLGIGKLIEALRQQKEEE